MSFGTTQLETNPTTSQANKKNAAVNVLHLDLTIYTALP